MSDWTLEYDALDPADEDRRETLCAVGNGYMVVRACANEARRDEVHYPGLYVAGLYDRLPTEVDGVTVDSDELVNLPDARGLRFEVDGEVLRPETHELVSYHQRLDLARGITLRVLHLRDASGRVTVVRYEMLASLLAPHLYAIRAELEPENWEGEVEAIGWVDGDVCNDQVPADRDLDGCHLEVLRAEVTPGGYAQVTTRTRGGDLRISVASRMRARATEGEVACESRCASEHEVEQRVRADVAPGRKLVVEKTVAVFTSRDEITAEPPGACVLALDRAEGFAELAQRQARAWAMRWDTHDIRLPEHPEATRLLRLHMFHLLQTTGEHDTQADIGTPARGWHGEAYRGHVFWDELLLARVTDLRMPMVSRAILLYRYNRLGAARERARRAGLRGAMFPWRSSSHGREETPVLRFNRLSQTWHRDHTDRQRHIASAVAYGAWGYYGSTADTEFLYTYGAELLCEVAKLWSSLATHDPRTGRYHIRGVVGPNEFHWGKPGTDEPGIDDDTYTNVMAAWVLLRASEVLELLPPQRRRALCELLGIDEAERAGWQEVARNLHVPFLAEGIPAEHDGFGSLAEVDWEALRASEVDLRALDEVLEARGDSANRFRLCKQVGILMLLYLFPPHTLLELLREMGYACDEETLRRSIDYYFECSVRGSTISDVVHAWICARFEIGDPWETFLRSLRTEVVPSSVTTGAGIHLGLMAGTVDIVQRVFAGVGMEGAELHIEPRMPPALHRVDLKLYVRGHYLSLQVEPTRVRIASAPGTASALRIVLDGSHRILEPGERCELPVPPRQSA